MNKSIDRYSFAIYYCVCWIIFHAVRFVDGLCLHQLHQPFIYDQRQDPIIWLMQTCGLSKYIVASQFMSGAFDLGLIALIAFLLIRSINIKPSNWLWLTFIFLFGFYVLTILSFPTLSVRKYLGLVIIPIMFIGSSKWYDQFFEWLRYFCLFIFASASVWKIVRGSIFDLDHLSNVLRSQHFDSLVHFPDHWITKFILQILEYPMFTYIGFLMVVVIQLAFVIGFFTKKYDWYLLCLMITFIGLDFIFMRIEYWEFVVFLPLLLEAPLNNYQRQLGIFD